MEQPELGKKILALRLAKGLTQNELADKCNISLRTIQRIESADVTPRSFTIKVIFSNLDYEFYNSINETDKKEQSNYQSEKRLELFYKYILDLFNLKKNTMKKLSFLSVLLLLVAFLIKTESNAQSIDGWSKAGSKPKSYEVGFDKNNVKTGKKSAYIESIEEQIEGFGTLMQSCNAKNYLGKKIKMTAYVKSQNVAGWSGLWLRVDSKTSKKPLSFDNMSNRSIKGTTDWKKYEIILDVPLESSKLNYGLLINGTGKVWFDQLNIEIIGDIDSKISTTDLPDKPTNIDFEE